MQNWFHLHLAHFFVQVSLGRIQSAAESMLSSSGEEPFQSGGLKFVLRQPCNLNSQPTVDFPLYNIPNIPNMPKTCLIFFVEYFVDVVIFIESCDISSSLKCMVTSFPFLFVH